MSLNGTWLVEDTVSADRIPQTFQHSVSLPGLANLAKPPFQNVDQFDSREAISNRVRSGVLPVSAWTSLEDAVGVSRQERNYFWYQKSFKVPAKKQVAILKINKAQFGTAVWLNGRKIGDHLGCFTAAYFNLTDALDWQGENRLLVRIGAHPGVLSKGVPAGTDFEKNKWTPGIYDNVSLLLADNPVIETLQVAPRVEPSEIVVQTKIKNYSNTASTFELTHHVKTWKYQQEVSRAPGQRLELQPGEERTWTQTIPIPKAELWSPENPFLYTLETSTGGDSVATRFGMRELRFDTSTRRAYLNGKVYFLRGSNITLHRFFEDPKCGALPWTEKWVRKLLIEIPKQMNWNTFRFCIGPVPDQWLDVADEAGLLIQNEFFVWTGHPLWAGKYSRHWDAEEMIRQYKEWVRDNWNHPSVVIWDANNETLDDLFADKIIPSVRPLDLSNRPWENSYNGPFGPEDPVEDHPYLFIGTALGAGKPFQMTDLEGMQGFESSPVRPPNGHAMINNEYGWLWLNRDGTPTKLTAGLYAKLLGPNATAEERFALNAYLLAGLTEFWRAYRNYAGLLHFVYLTASYPGVYTSDHFRDVEALDLEPHFADYVREAFKPLGVYINFWQPTLEAGSNRRLFVMLVNDDHMTVEGKLVLSLETEENAEIARHELPFAIPGLGQQTYKFDLLVPDKPEKCLLKATAYPEGKEGRSPTVSRRKVTITQKSH
jgi:hypothetical protein